LTFARFSNFSVVALVLAASAYSAAQQLRATDSVGCSPPPDAETIFHQRDIRFLIIGELHGTQEIPAAFGELVCFVAAAGSNVLVGLEFPESARSSFEQYVESSGSQADRASFLHDSGWLVDAQQYPDGRTSEAMLKLVDRLRELRAAGLGIGVTTFVRPQQAVSDPQTTYEIGIADSLKEAAQLSQYDLIIALVGNVHARKVTFDAEGVVSFDPMAMHLPTETTLALHAISNGGEAWNCNPNCGRHRHDGSLAGSDPRIEFQPDVSSGYDGILAVGTTTASLPVTHESQ
jgi:hypothetical protein